MAIVNDFPAIKENMERRPSKDDMIKEWFRNLSLEEKETMMASYNSSKAWRKLLDNRMFENIPGFLYSKVKPCGKD